MLPSDTLLGARSSRTRAPPSARLSPGSRSKAAPADCGDSSSVTSERGDSSALVGVRSALPALLAPASVDDSDGGPGEAGATATGTGAPTGDTRGADSSSLASSRTGLRSREPPRDIILSRSRVNRSAELTFRRISAVRRRPRSLRSTTGEPVLVESSTERERAASEAAPGGSSGASSGTSSEQGRERGAGGARAAPRGRALNVIWPSSSESSSFSTLKVTAGGSPGGRRRKLPPFKMEGSRRSARGLPAGLPHSEPVSRSCSVISSSERDAKVYQAGED